MTTRATLDIHFHPDQTVTIEGVTLRALDAYPILEEAVNRTPRPQLNFIRDETAGYESIGKIIYQSVRAGFQDEDFSWYDPSTRLVFRPAMEAEIPFLLKLRHETMDAPQIASGITPTDEAHMQRIRFAFEHAQIVELAGEPIGLLKLVRSAPVWDLIQIQVAPSHQGKGVGERLLRKVMAQATAAGVPVKLSVYKVNPARRLYERLGFVITGETDDAYDMLFAPPAK